MATTQTEWQAAQEFAEGGRAGYRKAAPLTHDQKDAMHRAVVTKTTRPQRMMTALTVAGPIGAVALYVGWLMETDTCTPHYEHMLWRICSVNVNGNEDDSLALVTLTKSHYAGD